jgi:hypothetical protein
LDFRSLVIKSDNQQLSHFSPAATSAIFGTAVTTASAAILVDKSYL